MAAVFPLAGHQPHPPGHRSGRSGLPARWLACGLVCGLAWAAGAGAQPLPGDPSTQVDFAQQVLEAVNRHRVAHHLAPWQGDDTLAAIATEHSRTMARQGALSHEGFQARFERAQRRVCVENLAARYRQADGVVAGWQASPAHGENLLDTRVQQVGVASVGGYVTLLACSAARAPAAR